MPCYFPMQATYTLRSDGKRDIKFSEALARQYYAGMKIECENHMSIPCGYCLGCRLEKSRQWAVRCVHEASMYERNCFLTLTYAPEFLPKRASLDKDVMPLFNKRLRQFAIPESIRTKRKFSELRKQWVKDHPVRFFYCGEYGGQTFRPHYHELVFNFDFSDREYWKTVNGIKYYTSKSLQELWPYGFSTIGSVTFNSAAYVARYSLKKVYGNKADDHYRRICPETGEEYFLEAEFCRPSRKPGIGKPWFEKWAPTDVFPNDSVVSRGAECKLPRYYDSLWDQMDPHGFALVKESRRVRQVEKPSEHNTQKRLEARMKCQEARVARLIRTMEG